MGKLNTEVNFIRHYKNVNAKLFEENDFNATHISLYNALFQLWNNCGFQNTLSVNRNGVMNLSKIGSVNTYLKCIKDLDKKKYIKYNPSHNPLKGSTVNLFRFDTSSDIVVNKLGTSSDTSSDTLYKLLNKETIKLLKQYSKEVNLNLKHWLSLNINSDTSINDIEYIYSVYPSVCVVKKTSTGKTKKNKIKIKELLKAEYTKDKLSKIIIKYTSDCKKGNIYMKNFSTFLNNIPDFETKDKSTQHSFEASDPNYIRFLKNLEN